MLRHIARRLTPRWLWSRLRTYRMRRVLAAFKSYTVQHVYSGVPLTVRISDPLAQGWYDHDWPRLIEVDLLREGRLTPGARVFDLGAHQGVVALILAHHVGATGEVIAVEALPHNAAACSANRDLNEARQIRVEPAAISDRIGEVEIGADLIAQVRNASTLIRTIRVPAVTVDELADRYGMPAVLFIDVEGHECHALRSAPRVLASRPDWYIEVHRERGLELAGGSVDELFRLLPEGYKVVAWTAANLAPKGVTRPEDCPSGPFYMVGIWPRR